MASSGRASGTSNINSEFNQVYELIHNPPTAQVSDAMRDCEALIKTGCQHILESSDPQTHHSLDDQNLQKAQTLASMQTTKGATVETDLQVLIKLQKTTVKEKINRLKLEHSGQDLSKLEAIEKDMDQISAVDSGSIETKVAEVQKKADEADKEAQKEEQKNEKHPRKDEEAQTTSAGGGMVTAPRIPPMETAEQTAIRSFMDERYGQAVSHPTPSRPTRGDSGR